VSQTTPDKPNARRSALVYRTHFWNDAIQIQVRKLVQAVSDHIDVWVVGYAKEGEDFSVPPSIRKIVFNESYIKALRFPIYCNVRNQPIPPRNIDMTLLHFFRMHPEYEQYWMIEFDVRYSGDWKKFFSTFVGNDSDFLGTAIQRYEENPGWAHWSSVCTGQDKVASTNFVKSFTPVIRLSNRGFEAINDAYLRGWYGHYEALWPTVIANACFKIEEIGNEGSFTPAERLGKYYTTTPSHTELWPGTFIFRPLRPESVVKEAADMLWHPVKTKDTPKWFEGAGGVHTEAIYD
jgi:hypothetical protein